MSSPLSEGDPSHWGEENQGWLPGGGDLKLDLEGQSDLDDQRGGRGHAEKRARNGQRESRGARGLQSRRWPTAATWRGRGGGAGRTQCRDALL